MTISKLTIPKLCSKFNRGSQKVYEDRSACELALEKKQTWYLRPSSSSLNSMLPPRHSVTLKPSSFSSPVNSRLTPFNMELVAACMWRQDVNSEMMSENCRVLSPDADICVLWTWDECVFVGWRNRKNHTFRAWDHISRLLDVLNFGQRQYETRDTYQSRLENKLRNVNV